MNESTLSSISLRPLIFFPWIDTLKTPIIQHELVKDYRSVKSRLKLLVGDGGENISPLQIIDNYYAVGEIVNPSPVARCFLLLLENPLMPIYHYVDCDQNILHLVICENVQQTWQTIPSVEDSKLYVCDGINDCPITFDDELSCVCKVNETEVHNNTFCFTSCHTTDCTCSVLCSQSNKGGCKQYSRSDGQVEWTSVQKKNNLTDKNFFSCKDLSKISQNLINDTVPDCIFGEDEYSLNGENIVLLCPLDNMIECC